MSRLAIVATALLAVFGGGQPVSAEEAISEPRCLCGLSSGADVLNAGRPIFSDLANASANERDSRIDGHAVRYPGDHDRSTLPYTVEPIDISHRE
jgi:hypothetical protein